MKKVIALVFCLVFCFSFAACNKQTPAGDSGSGNNQAIESYIEKSKDQLDQLAGTFESSGMKLSISARGNALVYTCKYTIDIEDTATVKSGLETAMESMSSTFQTILAGLKKEVSSAESLIVEYLDKDGKEIYSKEFK
ncbi:MAG: DUF4854 domain-containing protein [Clostridiales bacterium]|jgi:uncharacterized lipoprotein YehR (DUF1307 family)|nr:DUF4854 domain-containing protein [Clostridiales bacterium]